MVKGLARRVIVVNPPDNQFFEQAIFIMRDASGDTDEDALVRQACNCAEDYVRKKCRRKKKLPLPAPLFALAGAAVTGIAWILTLLN